MNALFAAMIVWLPFTAAPVLLVLLAPTAGTRLRTTIAILLAGGAAASLACVFFRSGGDSLLEVINPFFDPDVGEPIPFVVETVRAPGWHLPVVGAGLLIVPAAVVWLRRHRPPGVPCPVVFTALVTLWTFLARLGLENSAAPEALAFATGVTIPMLLSMPFVGWWSGRKNPSIGRFAMILLLIGLIQRSLIVIWGFFATKFHLGTHLDVSAIHKISLLLGDMEFTGPGDQTTAQWIALVVIPQYLLWIPITLVAGLVLGGVPFTRARRRSLIESG